MMHTLQLAIRILAYPPSYLHNAIVNKFASQNYSVKPSNMQTFQKTSFNRYVEITVANITVGPSSSGMFTNGGVLGELQKTPGGMDWHEIVPAGENMKGLREKAQAIGIELEPDYGIQTRKLGEGKFQTVSVESVGEYGVRPPKYLYTVDENGINLMKEETEFPGAPPLPGKQNSKAPRGMPVHTNISPNGAFFGGEMWFGEDGAVTANFGSVRYPIKADDSHDKKALERPLDKDAADYPALLEKSDAFAAILLNLGYPKVRIVLPGDRFKPDAECMVYEYRTDPDFPDEKRIVGWVEKVFPAPEKENESIVKVGE